MFSDAPGEPERRELGWRRPPLRHGPELSRVEVGLIGGLGQQPAENAPVLDQPRRQGRPVAPNLEHAALLLRPLELLERIGGVGRSEQDLDKDPGQRLDHGAVERPIDADDPAVDRHRIRRLGADHRGADGVADGGAARVRVLDDDRGRLRELEQ